MHKWDWRGTSDIIITVDIRNIFLFSLSLESVVFCVCWQLKLHAILSLYHSPCLYVQVRSFKQKSSFMQPFGSLSVFPLLLVGGHSRWFLCHPCLLAYIHKPILTLLLNLNSFLPSVRVWFDVFSILYHDCILLSSTCYFHHLLKSIFHSITALSFIDVS